MFVVQFNYHFTSEKAKRTVIEIISTIEEYEDYFKISNTNIMNFLLMTGQTKGDVGVGSPK